MDERRREFLLAVTSGAALIGCGADAGGREPRSARLGGEAEVTPGEDLMQEHGLLERILLLYGEAAALRRFERMYRPHAAREDTVLFPAFRGLLGAAAYRELGERFEAEEHARLGARGFAGAVSEVARLEEALGIADLAAFTP